ncbi:MAG: SUMF1/EgtB/PvdO family nonheme iron enzyme, partial [Saprospiraceae bacterium]|nr:SUMF1/EgtB/PvdO family nonheme iron enzyme [Saprospiraceae bacterium]
MRQTLLHTIFFLLASVFLATAQSGISFQGILRNSDGELIASGEVSLRMALAQGTPEGPVVFEELHTVTTSPNGLFSLMIGTGTPVSGDLMDINWQSGAYFLRASIESVGGEPWALEMDMSLLAVPYAFFAATADSLTSMSFNPLNTPGQSLYVWSGSEWQPLMAGAPGTRLAVDSSGMPAWVLHQVPTLGRAVVVDSSSNTALIGYSLLDNGGLPLLRQGLVWGTSSTPVLERDRVLVNNTDSMKLLLDKLVGGDQYYVRAFAENALGVGYGSVLAFEVEGCTSDIPITLNSSSGTQVSDKEDVLVRVIELNDFEYVTYFINDQPFVTDGLVTELPNPGIDFTVYARGVDTIGCVALSSELSFTIVETGGTALAIPAFETPITYEALEVFSFAEEKKLDTLANFTIRYELSEGFDIVNLYDGDIYDEGKFLGATYIGYPQDTIYFSETETAYYMVFLGYGAGSEARQKNVRTYLATNALFLQLKNAIKADLQTLGYVDEYSNDKFDLVELIKADLGLNFNDESTVTDAPNPMLRAMGDRIQFLPEGNTLFYAAQVQDTTGVVLSNPVVFSGEPLADLPYMFRFFSRLFSDSRFLDALIFRSGSTSKLDSMDLLDRELSEEDIVVALDNGRDIVGEKYVNLTQFIENYNTSLHFYHLFSLFPSFKAVDGLLLTLDGGTPSDLMCLEGLTDVMDASQENFIQIFMDDEAGGAEALSLFSFVCYSLAEALQAESCTGQKSMYRLLNGLGNTANRALSTYNSLKFTSDVADATRSARHHFYVSDEGVFGKQVTTIEPAMDLSGVPNGFLSPDPALRLEEYDFYAEEQDATQTYLRIGERIPSGMFASGNRSIEVEVSFESFVESVSLGTETATSSPYTFTVNAWENIFRWKIKNSANGFTPGTRVKLGRIKAGAVEQDIFGVIEVPQIRYLANASTENLIVVEVHSNGQPLTGKYNIAFEIFAGGGTLQHPDAPGAEAQTILLETDESGRAVVRWNQSGRGDRLQARVLDATGNAYDSVIVSGGSALVFVEGGVFNMGCTIEQGSSCAADESPERAVTLSGFFIGRFEVTHAQWADVMGTDAGICPECPVVDVSLAEVQVYIDSLNARTGFSYRLPTEAEWEYAARGGKFSQGNRYAGGNDPGQVAWYQDNAPGGLREVGQKLPNELGIYDMSGNVGEWCGDWYGASYYAEAANNDPAGPESGAARVVRGGSWQSIAGDLRVSKRATLNPAIGNGSTGFRLVRAVNLPEVRTVAITGLTDSSAVASGQIISDGGLEILERGFVWSIFEDPTLADRKVANGGTGSGYSNTITDLSPGRTYYARAYATSRAGTAYGESLEFTIPAVLPEVETSLVSDLTNSTALAGGNVLSDGGAAVVARGVVWGTSEAPTLEDNSSDEGGGTGSFSSNISGLLPFTTYYIRAYATNSVGTAYGQTVTVTTLPGIPQVITVGVSELTDSSGLSGGQVTSDGGAAVTARGVVWDTLTMPVLLTDRFTTDGTGVGVFESNLSGLRPGVTYYLRAYATNSVGTAYGEEVIFATPAVLPVVVTDTITAITDSSAVSGGRVVSDGGALVTARGVVWSATPNPTLAVRNTANGTGTGAFVSNLRDLLPGTRYYVRAYATNVAGTVYGQELNFVTPAILPTVVTDTVTAITDSSAVSGGEVVGDGGAEVTARGIVWDISPNPVVGTDSTTTEGSGTGIFTATLKDLLPGTTYYVRAYATNIAGTAYGENRSFITPAILPEVRTDAITNITDSSAVSRGEVLYDGGGTITARGIVWGTVSTPTLADNRTLAGTGTGLYASSIAGLSPGTTYYVRAYATNEAGTAYGAVDSFVTQAILPVVVTDTITSITSTTAVGGGQVTFDGGAAVTARGIAWSTAPGSAVDSLKTTNGTGEGAFVSNMGSLSPGTTYYVRAYATNAVGTAYGAERTFSTLAVLPVVVTDSIMSITDSSAVSGGQVTYDGGAAVTARGLVWDTLADPTLEDWTLQLGNGVGAFNGVLTNIEPTKTYYVRAYATNAVGTAYGQRFSFTAPAGLPRVSTTSISALTDSSAVSGGTVTSERGSAVTARGVVWSRNLTPDLDSLKTTDGAGSGVFASQLSGLSPGTTYYARAYATNAIGTGFGEVVSFVTPAILPTITTDTISAITDSSAVGGGNITFDGGAAITARGIVWGTNPNPTLDSMKTTNGTGAGIFSSILTGLAPVTTYYVRAYATNAVGTTYGAELSFTTPVALPELTTTAITAITDTRAETGGSVTFDGGAAITARGVAWGTSPQPTIAGMRTTNGSGTGTFASTVTGLSPVTTYYVRAYATNAAGTGYGPELSFVTPPSLPLVSTASLSNLMATSATAGGNVLNDGGAAVTARGIVWDTLAQPTLADFIVTVGDSLGIFSTPISGLIPGKIYYLRAYATNAAGTSYGEEISFVTPPVVPVVTTVAPTAITDSSATGGGTVTYNGGASISARGVVWGLSPNLTLDSMKTTDGTGTGAFVSNITGLSPVTTYYVRGYATNAAGTAYGEALSFTTLATVPTVTTDAITALTDSSAVSGGNVVDDGGTPVTARGLVWGRGTGPTLDSLKTVNGSGNGTFTATIPNLDPETRYYVRAYATNARGTTYGNEVTFLTPAGLPRVTTLSISSLTDSSAVAAGNVLSDRGASVTARGIIWGRGANLTLDSTIVAGGSGTGLFSGNISGLSPNTKYYVRAYATNAVGTRYGNVVSFTTPISMVLVQGGTFTMGCTPEQGGDCDTDENYPHDVTLPTFYLGRYEITQAAWEAVMGSNPSTRAACPTCPVETVSWNDVQEYITRLNIETGFDYRLPTEAEWEYAARGGIASNGYKYAGGDGVDSIAWYLTNASGQTQEVGQKTPNELDLYDMSGNVWEWVSDRYEGIYDSVAVTNPTGPASGTQRVVRGGSWFALEADLRVSERSAFGPTDSQPII